MRLNKSYADVDLKEKTRRLSDDNPDIQVQYIDQQKQPLIPRATSKRLFGNSEIKQKLNFKTFKETNVNFYHQNGPKSNKRKHIVSVEKDVETKKPVYQKVGLGHYLNQVIVAARKSRSKTALGSWIDFRNQRKQITNRLQENLVKLDLHKIPLKKHKDPVLASSQSAILTKSTMRGIKSIENCIGQ